jgi:hypothetical protein
MASMAARGSHLSPILLRCLLPGRGKPLRIGDQFILTLASLRRRCPGYFGGERQSTLQQIACHDPVNDTGLMGFRRGHRIAGHAHRQSFFDAGQTRQPLRSRRAWNDAEFHLGLSDLRTSDGHPVMSGHRSFEPAAERRTVNRHHDRLGRILDSQQLRQQGEFAPLAGGDLAEFLNIGAGNERPSRADDDDRLHPGIAIGLLDPGDDALRNARTEGVHRRIVDRDDGDGAVFR